MTISFLSIVLNLLVLPSVSAQSEDTDLDFEKYVDHEYGIEFLYPADWEQFEGPACSSQNILSAVSFASPIGTVMIAFVIEKLDGNYTSQQFSDEALQDLVQNHTFKTISKNLTKLDNLSANQFTIRGSYDYSKLDACPVEPILQGLNAPMKMMATSTVLKDSAYTISYSTVPLAAEMFHGSVDSAFSTYLPIVDPIIDSFKFINKNQSDPVISPKEETNGDFCQIIKVRYAEGEITKEELIEKSRILGCAIN
jgi:hypothetical protein